MNNIFLNSFLSAENSDLNIMYLQEIFRRWSFLCICRKSSFVEASDVFAGNLPS